MMILGPSKEAAAESATTSPQRAPTRWERE